MKTEIGAKNCLYPMLTTLVGVNVQNRPNYITIAHIGIMGWNSVSLAMGKTHFTNAGVRENRSFSINIPSRDLVRETDYCGLVSGRKVDKSTLFHNFYGKLGTAPMIRECPVNMECRLMKTVDFPSHDIFIGEIVNTYCDVTVLTEGIVDIRKVNPLLFAMNDRSYYSLGDRVAKAWDVGKELIARE
jgi:flavin reductase (DIM6/NTAB) family NADH-FMN oxidoreductase RutF